MVPAAGKGKNGGMAPLGTGTGFVSFLIPARMDGTGTTRLTTTKGIADHFKLWTIPRSPEAPPSPTDGSGFLLPTRGSKNGGKGYRIAYPAPGTRRGYRLARFRLKEGSTQQPLVLLCEHLDGVGVPWIWLTDENGARLSWSMFHSKNPAAGA